MLILRISFVIIIFLLLELSSRPGLAGEVVVLKGKAGVEAIFEITDTHSKWIAYKDVEQGRQWDIGGSLFSLQTENGDILVPDLSHFKIVYHEKSKIILETQFTNYPIVLKQAFTFGDDGRTLKIESSLRSERMSTKIKRIGLLEITVSGEKLSLTGPEYISFPVFGERIFAGIEHPSVECRINNDSLWLAQPSHLEIGQTWVNLPTAVFGSASDHDFTIAGEEGLRCAFINYLNTVRIKPVDMHVYYNDWWTAPIPNTEEFVLGNIDRLKRNLYDQTGFFFDSYIIDAGWSDIHSLWRISNTDFPLGFTRIRDRLHEVSCRPGLWTSPSSLYPSTLDNQWLAEQGYEVTPYERLGFNACLVAGGKYQTGYKNTIVNHIRNAGLNHIKFDGFIHRCDAENHGHPPGSESYLPLAEGLKDVFDTIITYDSTIVLEPTCFWIHASPWWLMHTPSVIGPFGDDSPKGRCPSPDWLESMTTAREIANLEGRKYFLMPSSALQCFDIVVQSPGAFQNHAVMAVGRGRWFISCYINPKFMDKEEWQFFADLMIWARHNREFLQEPIPIGGSPGDREAYGYAYRGKTRELYCLRNPWMEEAFIKVPKSSIREHPRQVRLLYPRREQLAYLNAEESLPGIHLGPYETKFVEVVVIEQKQTNRRVEYHKENKVNISWHPTSTPTIKHFIFEDNVQPLGSSWTCPEGETKETLTFNLEGEFEVKGAKTTDLFILCEGKSVKSAFPRIELKIDGKNPDIKISRSVGSFSAGGYTDEDWVWFRTSLTEGRHHLALEVSSVTGSSDFGVFLQGTIEASNRIDPFGSGPFFPLYQPESKSWSHTLVAPGETKWSNPIEVSRSLNRIEGIFLDKMDWTKAITGHGEVQRNKSIQGQPIVMGGRIYHRGIGTHSFSRIVYTRPADSQSFAATIGCQQTALAGTIVFVLEGDGNEIYRSPVFVASSDPIDIVVPVDGISELALIVEDSGDRINADHGNWADARFLKVSE